WCRPHGGATRRVSSPRGGLAVTDSGAAATESGIQPAIDTPARREPRGAGAQSCLTEDRMLTPVELQELRRDLADTRVLSVYLDTRVTDPAMRDTWRASLQNSIRSARASVTDEEDRARFDRAAEHLRDPQHPPGGAWGAPGWVAFATEDGVRHVSDLP